MESPKPYTLLKGRKEHLPGIMALVNELAVFEKEPDAVTATLLDYEKAFEKHLIDFIVATVNNDIIGMALYYDTFSTWKGKMLYLEDFYVQAEYRSLGIGAKLFDEVVEEARRRDCVLLKWQVLDWNKRAIQFYKSKNAEIETIWYNGKLWLDQT